PPSCPTTVSSISSSASSPLASDHPRAGLVGLLRRVELRWPATGAPTCPRLGARHLTARRARGLLRLFAPRRRVDAVGAGGRLRGARRSGQRRRADRLLQ